MAATTLLCACALYTEMPNSIMIKPDILNLAADVEVRIKINAWVFVFNIVKRQSAAVRAPDPHKQNKMVQVDQQPAGRCWRGFLTPESSQLLPVLTLPTDKASTVSSACQYSNLIFGTNKYHQFKKSDLNLMLF